MRFWRNRQRGQALVEWTLVMPIFILFVVACLQFTVIWWTYISVTNVVRDGTRWLSVHPHTTDSSFVTTMNGRLPSNLTSGNLTLTTSPTCASLSSGVCAGRSTGSQLGVTGSYTITGLLFLPTQFGWDPWKIQIPTTLPAFTMYMPVEPV